ncbi:hypothetical protein [Variovorax paradoxus]|uniref:hypothetical protein n=1 Tax=Variovorax paradoxus TaxID=34073 RepID=UPI0019325505|nr:hypothetical protein INQ48_43505 [Variovorax paradoxus]
MLKSCIPCRSAHAFWSDRLRYIIVLWGFICNPAVFLKQAGVTALLYEHVNALVDWRLAAVLVLAVVALSTFGFALNLMFDMNEEVLAEWRFHIRRFVDEISSAACHFAVAKFFLAMLGAPILSARFWHNAGSDFGSIAMFLLLALITFDREQARISEHVADRRASR